MLKQRYWKKWIEKEVERRRKVYLTEPDQLISDYNREIDHSKGYSQRGLLELIQNADDAGLDYNKPNKLLIKLTDNHLFVANTGSTFSKSGIKSLMVSDNSPKQFRAECIGYKGLGFRSVLNWTSSVIILSGNLSVCFDKRISSDFLKDLKKENKAIRSNIKKFEDSNISNPIATFSIPKFISENDLEKSELNDIYKEGNKIKNQGYDTVICLPLENNEKLNDVQNEINSLFKEILLFLKHLENITLISPKRDECWDVKRSEKKVKINPQNKKSKEWRVFEKSGTIPKEHLEPNQIKDKYEIKLAIPINNCNYSSSRDLFVFFPTKVTFPFPILAHATFEVTENRNHLTISKTNHFVAKELTSLMVETAEKLKNTTNNRWFGLSLVSPKGEIDSTLNELGSKKDEVDFEDILINDIKKKALIPVQNDGFKTPKKAKRIDGDFGNLLKRSIFNDICIYTIKRNIIDQLERLDVDEIWYPNFKNRINKISSNLSLEEKARFIERLVKTRLLNKNYSNKYWTPPNLLVDGEGELISSGITVFLPPSGETISLPDWIPQKILNPKLTSLLRKKFGVSSIRDLRLKLKPFNVREYNLTGLIRSVVAETNRRVKKNPDQEFKWRKKMLSTLWNLYSTNEDNVTLPSDLTIILPTRDNGFENASSLYLGDDYPNGKLLESLYGPIESVSFIISPNELDFCDDDEDLEKFFCWLGVANSPRKKEITVSDDDYLESIIDNIEYPAKFENITIDNPEEVKKSKPKLDDVQIVEGLENILEKSNPHAIISWLTSISSELDSWRQDGDRKATLKIRPYRKQYYRTFKTDSLPSYSLWLLENKKWLPVENGGIQSPKFCSIALVARDLSPIVGYPSVDMKNALFRELNIDKISVKVVLSKIGVKNTLIDLSWDAFYEILLKLPEVDPEGEKAKNIYRTLIESVEDDPYGKNYERFIEDGKMLGKIDGETEYYPINKLFYLENANLPESIVERYPILELDQRRGAKKVEKIFGVEKLSMQRVSIENIDFKIHPLSNEFDSQIDRLKPVIYALRIDKDQDFREMKKIREKKLNLCDSVKITASVKNDKFDLDLGNGKFIIKDSQVFLVYEPKEYERNILYDSELAYLLGDIFTSILNVNLRNEVRILACSRDRLYELNNLISNDPKKTIEKAEEYIFDGKKLEISFVPPDTKEEVSDETEKENSKIKDKDISRDVEKIREENGRKEKPSTLKIEEKKLPITNKRKIKIRRIKKKQRSPIKTGPRKIADADLAEEIAFQFEESKNRFPILVSNIQGERSYGCDIISFNTLDHKDEFLKERNSEKIDRLIEVKGSTREKGSTTLKDNELKTAQKERTKYYIYRIYENSQESDKYALLSLNDPLGCSSALERKIEVNPFYTEESDYFELKSITE